MKTKHYFYLVVSFFITTLNGFSFFRVVVIGDSIGSGYGITPGSSFVQVIERQLRKQHHDLRLINISTPARSLASTERDINSLLEFAGKPDLYILELGGNDFLQGASVEISTARLERLYNVIRSHYAKVPLLIVGAGYVSGAASSPYKQVAEKYHLSYLEGFSWEEKDAIKMRQVDNIHPNEEGHREIAQAISKELKLESESSRSVEMAKP